MMLTVVGASTEQIEKIYRKHLKPLVFNLSYSYDSEDDVGFVTARSIWGAKIEYQMRGKMPCFFGLVVGSVRYDISYPKGQLKERLLKLALKAKKSFWSGGAI